MTTILFAETTAQAAHVHAEVRQPVYFPALDGLRALAFLLVFGLHYMQLPWGSAGVDAFFVLSGFLITGILYDTCNDPYRARNFYIRRTLRIFPLYYGVMLAVLFTYPLAHWQITWSWLVWPAYLGNFVRLSHLYPLDQAIQRLADAQPVSRTVPQVKLLFGHFWSLCVEEQFYLFWPWLVFWIKDRRKLIYVCAATVILCPVARIVAHAHLPHDMLEAQVLYRFTPFRLDAMLLGGLIALLRRDGRERLLLQIARFCFPLCCAFFLVYAYRHRGWHPFSVFGYPDWQFTWGLTLVDLLFASLIVLALTPRSFTFQVFSWYPLRWLGRITYGAYVFHDILRLQYIRLAAHLPTNQNYTATLIGFVSTLLLAWASYRWLEAPLIRRKDNWTRTTPQPPAAGA